MNKTNYNKNIPAENEFERLKNVLLFLQEAIK